MQSQQQQQPRFIRSYNRFEIEGLKPVDASIMNHLMSLMELSHQNSQNYYDPDERSHFVIFTCEKMAQTLNMVAKSISNAYQRLEKAGWIKRVAIKGVSYQKIFIPKYAEIRNLDNFSVPTAEKITCPPEKNSGTHRKKFPPIYSYKTDIEKLSSNTVNTARSATNVDTNAVAPAQKIQKPFQTPKILKPAQSATKDFKISSNLDLLRQSATAKLGLPVAAVETIVAFARHDCYTVHTIIERIIEARNSVVKEYHLRGPKTKFESNGNIQRNLDSQLQRIFSYIQKKGFEQYDGYLVKACQNFFAAALGVKADVPVETPQIPRARANGSHKRIIEKLPAWAQKKRDAEKQAALVRRQQAAATAEPTAEERASVNQALAELALRKLVAPAGGYDCLKQLQQLAPADLKQRLQEKLPNSQPEVLDQVMKLVEQHWDPKHSQPDEATEKKPQAPTMAPIPAGVDPVEYQRTQHELAELSLTKQKNKQADYIETFQGLNLKQILHKLTTDAISTSLQVIQEAAKIVQDQLKSWSQPAQPAPVN